MNKFNIIIVLSFLLSGILYAQEKDEKFMFRKLTNEQNKIIDDIFGSKSHLLSETDYSKSWSYLMTPEILDNNLLGHCIEDKNIIKCGDILEEEDWRSLQSKIINLRSFKLEKSRLLKLNLYNNITEKADAYKITAPIIIKDYAFFKHSSIDNETIIIAKKVSGTWKTWCRKKVFFVTY